MDGDAISKLRKAGADISLLLAVRRSNRPEEERIPIPTEKSEGEKTEMQTVDVSEDSARRSTAEASRKQLSEKSQQIADLSNKINEKGKRFPERVRSVDHYIMVNGWRGSPAPNPFTRLVLRGS